MRQLLLSSVGMGEQLLLAVGHTEQEQRRLLRRMEERVIAHKFGVLQLLATGSVQCRRDKRCGCNRPGPRRNAMSMHELMAKAVLVLHAWPSLCPAGLCCRPQAS